MHIRERGQIVQIIRTKYDAATKKGKNEIVGRMSKSKPQITTELKSALSAQELKEVNEWIASRATVDQLKRDLAVRTLAETMALAEQWFADHKGDDARQLAESVVQAWFRLRSVLKKSGFAE